ncbi:MAG: hypothetical protein LBN07_04130 [Christensenellaceae bacterium]|jgi:hypothetical protein|nr:hypothetical protein [Christensenellaceae bacterium]
MVSKSLLGGLFDGLVNWIIGLFDCIFQSLLAVITCMFYLIIWAIAQFIKIAEVIFKKLLGIDTNFANPGDPTNGEPLFNDLISQFLFSEPVRNVFISLLALSVLLLFIFTFIAIIRSEFTMDVKNSAKGPIIARALKSLAMFVIVPVVAYFGLIMTCVLGQAVWRMFNAEDTGIAEQVLYLTASNANKAKNNENFAKYINGEIHNAPWASDNTYYNNNGGGFKVNSNDIDVIQAELSTQIDDAFRKNTDMNGNRWKLLGLSGSAGSPNLERDNLLIHPTRGTQYSFWDIGIVSYYYSYTGMNYIMGFLSGLFMLYIMFKLCSQLIKRIFEIVLLMLLAAPMHSIAPLDNGNAAKQWQQNFIRRVIMILGPIFAINMYFVMMNALEDVDFANTLSVNYSVDQTPVAVSVGTTEFVIDYDGTTMVQGDQVMAVSALGSEASVAASMGYNSDTVAAAAVGSSMLAANGGASGVTDGVVNMFFYFLFAICGLQVIESAGSLLASILGMDDMMKDAVGGINKTMQGFADPDKMMKTGMKLGGGAAGSLMAKGKKNEAIDYGMNREKRLDDAMSEEQDTDGNIVGPSEAMQHYTKAAIRSAQDRGDYDQNNDYSQGYRGMSDEERREYTMQNIVNTESGDKQIKEMMALSNADKNIFERGRDRRAYMAGKGVEASDGSGQRIGADGKKRDIGSEKDDPASYLGKKQRAFDNLHESGLDIADMWKGKGVLAEVLGDHSALAKDMMGQGAKLDGMSKAVKFDEPKEWKDARDHNARMWYGQHMNKDMKNANKKGGSIPDNVRNSPPSAPAPTPTATPQVSNTSGGAEIEVEGPTSFTFSDTGFTTSTVSGGGDTSSFTTGGGDTGSGGDGGSSPAIPSAADRKAIRRAERDRRRSLSDEQRAAEDNAASDNIARGMSALSNATGRSVGSGTGSNIKQNSMINRMMAPLPSTPTKVDISNLQQFINEFMQRLKTLMDSQSRRLEEIVKKINSNVPKAKTYSGKDRNKMEEHKMWSEISRDFKEFQTTVMSLFASGKIDQDGNPTSGPDNRGTFRG